MKQTRKVPSRQIVRRVRAKLSTDAKKNVAFKLSVSLMDRFREKCKKEKLPQVAVIEELLEAFLAE